MQAACKRPRTEPATGRVEPAPLHIRPVLLKEQTRRGSRWRCEWNGVRSGVSNVKARKRGLFATQRLRKGTRIDYFGVRLSRTAWDAQRDQSYCVGIHGPSGSSFEFIDGHPDWQSKWTPECGLGVFAPKLPRRADGAEEVALSRLPADLLIGGLVNEPVKGESVSLKIVGTERTAYFEAIRDVEPGEELLTLYGEEFVRDYPTPYGWLR